MKNIPSIKKSDCKFYVNKDARVVVCVILNTQNILYDFIEDNFHFKDFDPIISLWDYRDVDMPKSFSGKAVCSEEDEWDEEVGKLIAYTRAREKLYRSFFRRANTLVNLIDQRLNDMISTFNDLGDRVTDWQENLAKQIDKKTKGEA